MGFMYICTYFYIFTPIFMYIFTYIYLDYGVPKYLFLPIFTYIYHKSVVFYHSLPQKCDRDVPQNEVQTNYVPHVPQMRYRRKKINFTMFFYKFYPVFDHFWILSLYPHL